MAAFAKLFGSDEDQILVVLDSDEDGNPAVIFSSKPKGLGVCRASVSFDDSDEGWRKAEIVFGNANEENARSFVQKMHDDMGISAVLAEG